MLQKKAFVRQLQAEAGDLQHRKRQTPLAGGHSFRDASQPLHPERGQAAVTMTWDCAFGGGGWTEGTGRT